MVRSGTKANANTRTAHKTQRPLKKLRLKPIARKRSRDGVTEFNPDRNRAAAFRWGRPSLSSAPRRIFAPANLLWSSRLLLTRETWPRLRRPASATSLRCYLGRRTTAASAERHEKEPRQFHHRSSAWPGSTGN